MRTIVQKVAILVFLIIATSSISNAETVHFTLNITDTYTCSPSWSGDYCAQIYVMEGSVQYCLTTICSLKTGDNDISYSCDLPYSERNQNYKIYVTVCRHQTPPSCCGSSSSGLLYFYQVTNGSTYVAVSL